MATIDQSMTINTIVVLDCLVPSRVFFSFTLLINTTGFRGRRQMYFNSSYFLSDTHPHNLGMLSIFYTTNQPV